MSSWTRCIAGAGAGTVALAAVAAGTLLAVALLGFHGWSGTSTARGAERRGCRR